MKKNTFWKTNKGNNNSNTSTNAQASSHGEEMHRVSFSSNHKDDERKKFLGINFDVKNKFPSVREKKTKKEISDMETSSQHDVNRRLKSPLESDLSSYNQKIIEQVEHRQKNSLFRLKPGEHELLSGLVTYFTTTGEPGLDGVLYVTNFRLHFEPAISRGQEIFVPLMTIAKVEKLKKEKGLEVLCKDFRAPKIVFTTDWGDRLYDFLNQVAFSEKSRNFFAFDYGALVSYPQADDGWEIYNAEGELQRIFRAESPDKILQHGWRISYSNRNYELCPTYPPVFAVPKETTDQNLEKVAQFRSSARIPILSWWDPVTTATILRSSQPNVGLTGRERSMWDENLFQGIGNANRSNRKVYLLDARPRLNAVANQANKGGFENISVYGDAEIEFCDIGNIHVMRESFEKLKSACLGKTGSWWSALDSSKWFDHITLVLSASVRMSRLVTIGYSVLCHCSDGWDRTSQMVSLAMLMIDPFYRTIRGFEVLVEKEWCSAGHRFDTRTGHGSKNISDSQRAPIFVQWLDCVYQLLVQFPYYFQFNESFLIEIFDALFSCEFGTFLYDCDRDRRYARAFCKEHSKQRFTVSLWSHINANLSKFTNVFYRQELIDRIVPRTEAKFLLFWKSNYLRHLEGGLVPVLDPTKELGLLKTRVSELEELLLKEQEHKQIVRKTCEPLGRTHITNRPSVHDTLPEIDEIEIDETDEVNEIAHSLRGPQAVQSVVDLEDPDIQVDSDAQGFRMSLPPHLQWQIASFERTHLRHVGAQLGNVPPPVPAASAKPFSLTNSASSISTNVSDVDMPTVDTRGQPAHLASSKEALRSDLPMREVPIPDSPPNTLKAVNPQQSKAHPKFVRAVSSASNLVSNNSTHSVRAAQTSFMGFPRREGNKFLGASRVHRQPVSHDSDVLNELSALVDSDASPSGDEDDESVVVEDFDTSVLKLPPSKPPPPVPQHHMSSPLIETSESSPPDEEPQEVRPRSHSRSQSDVCISLLPQRPLLSDFKKPVPPPVSSKPNFPAHVVRNLTASANIPQSKN